MKQYAVFLLCFMSGSAFAASVGNEDVGAELFHVHRGPQAAVKELAMCKETLKNLGAQPPVIGWPARAKQMAGSVSNVFIASGLAAGGGIVGPALLQYANRRRERGGGASASQLATQRLAGAAGAVTLGYAIYRINEFVAARLAKANEAKKFAQFVAMWPSYRENAPPLISEIIEPMYKSFSVDGELRMTPEESAKMYRFLQSLMSLQIKRLTKQIQQHEQVKKQEEKNRRWIMSERAL